MRLWGNLWDSIGQTADAWGWTKFQNVLRARILRRLDEGLGAKKESWDEDFDLHWKRSEKLKQVYMHKELRIIINIKTVLCH